METIEILAGLRELGIRLAAADGELVLSGRTERLTPAFVAEIRAKKALLLDLLRRDAPGASDANAIRPRGAAEREGPRPCRSRSSDCGSSTSSSTTAPPTCWPTRCA
ncbi:hypothetical protein [Burkholderia gladioli]|uniref:hypothetical protein n=1 Tax=Burkholderia gladioli TaxID=28095 RepID=UPI001642B7BC|nr:hypothetical protein [Burkholderia gladioli]